MQTSSPQHQAESAHAAPARAPRLRLDFLDGIRGLAALYVVLYHAVLFTGRGHKADLSPPLRAFTRLLDYGHYSVAVFIVLSGFCLAMPVAASGDKQLRGGFKDYIKRRARRILPPYYAALGVFLLLIALVPLLQTPHGTAWDNKLPAFAPGVIASHLLLVHNLRPGWIFNIDGPMWSVATEWQIYFLFPLVLLPLWRRFGLPSAVVGGFCIGLLPHFLLPDAHNLDLMHPWYLGLFAFGMSGAIVALSEDAVVKKLRSIIAWRALTLGLAAILLALFVVKGAWLEAHGFVSETLVGLVSTVLIVHYTLLVKEKQVLPTAFKLFDSRVAVTLGLFSYSIYLIHSPLLALWNLATLNLSLSPDVRLILMFLIAVPLSVLASYLFHLAVERRFMSGHQAAVKQKLEHAESPLSERVVEGITG